MSDKKKKKSFLITLTAVNEYFTRNFSQLSRKGLVFLELENKKDPFDAGVAILVKTGHGKYFDVTSLSGGEQTMVALSLIFAIQELKPYAFYILDEIDARHRLPPFIPSMLSSLGQRRGTGTFVKRRLMQAGVSVNRLVLSGHGERPSKASGLR